MKHSLNEAFNLELQCKHVGYMYMYTDKIIGDISEIWYSFLSLRDKVGSTAKYIVHPLVVLPHY